MGKHAKKYLYTMYEGAEYWNGGDDRTTTIEEATAEAIKLGQDHFWICEARPLNLDNLDFDDTVIDTILDHWHEHPFGYEDGLEASAVARTQLNAKMRDVVEAWLAQFALVPKWLYCVPTKEERIQVHEDA